MRMRWNWICLRGVHFLVLAACAFAIPGCRKSGSPGTDSPFEINLQTDWFPQPEHGGFYQALAKGYYAEAGLRVNILPGGPNAMSTQKVLKGQAHFAMNRADTIYGLAVRDVPLLMVMSTLQHDPQAIMLHAGNPINRLQDLDGSSVMAIPGLMWIRWLEAKYNIRLSIIPHDFGMERFLNDPRFVQQCLLTNEPYYIREAGAEVKVLPLRESGFDPYHGIYCLKEFAVKHPDVVQRFVTASIRGWRDYILNNPAPALELIAGRNPKMNPGFMDYSYGKLRDEKLVTGTDLTGGSVGNLDDSRMETMVSEMYRLGLIEANPADETKDWYTRRFLVKPLDEPSGGRP